MLALQEHPIKFNLFPSKEEYMAARHWQSDDDNSKLRAGLTKELGEIFYDVTSHFINKYNDVSLLNWEKIQHLLISIQMELVYLQIMQ